MFTFELVLIYADSEDAEKEHLRLHPDRVFLVTVPSNTYFYDIEAAIKHVIVKLGIRMEDLEEKTQRNHLIQKPTSLEGFSCDICGILDSNSEKIALRHVKDEHGVKDRDNRSKYIVFFCRGCQVRWHSYHIFVIPLPCFIFFYRVNSTAMQS